MHPHIDIDVNQKDKWISEWMHEWMKNKRINEWMNQWKKKQIKYAHTATCVFSYWDLRGELHLGSSERLWGRWESDVLPFRSMAGHIDATNQCFIFPRYPLLMSKSCLFPSNMVIFHSYVKLPGGMYIHAYVYAHTHTHIYIYISEWMIVWLWGSNTVDGS